MRTSGLVLSVCAGLLLSGGVILGGSTACGLMRMSYFFWLSDLGVELGAMMLLAAGALLCLPACWVATSVLYYPKSLTLHATLMGLLMCSMVVLSVGLSSLGGLAGGLREPDALNASMQLAMARESANPSVRSAFSSMQLERDKCETPVFFGGCLKPALIQLRSFVGSASALTAALLLIMGATMCASVYILVSCVTESNSYERAKSLVSPASPLACVHNLPNPLATPLNFSTLLQPQAQPPSNK